MADHSSRFGESLALIFFRLTVKLLRPIAMVQLAQLLRSGQSYICAFCAWHEIGKICMWACKNQVEVNPNFDLRSVFRLHIFIHRFAFVILMRTLSYCDARKYCNLNENFETTKQHLWCFDGRLDGEMSVQRLESLIH